MLSNYLRIALRTLRRHRGYAFINVAGLAVGMACAILIGLYVADELSYDRFHDKADRIARVTLDLRFGDQETHTALTPAALGDALEEAFPAVEEATRLWRDPSGDFTVRAGDRAFAEGGVVFADADVFEVFSFPLLRGDPQTALVEPYTLVLTESTARKYFGDADPLGQTLTLREPSDRDLFDYRVTGVIADPPVHSHIRFDLLASLATQRLSRSENLLDADLYTYLLLRDGADGEAVLAQFPAFVEARVGAQMPEVLGQSYSAFGGRGGHYRLGLQPLTRIHLHSHLADEWAPNGDVRYVTFFVIVALLVLLLAVVNFVNLATARAAGRAREVGVRKAMGSGRGALVWQFLTEALLQSTLALGLAVMVAAALLPLLNQITGKSLEGALPGPVGATLVLLGFTALVGLAAGAYPALVLSSYRPVEALKPGLRGGRRSRLRSALVVFQFAVTVTLLVATLVVQRQMRLVQETRLGFDEEQVVILEGAEVLGRRIEPFKQMLLAQPGVLSVTNSELVPGRPFRSALFRAEGAPEDALVPLQFTYTGFDFAETLGLELTAGRTLDRNAPGDSLAVLLNEIAVARLGLVDPVGQRLVWPDESVYTIVGVVEDFHVASLRETIAPVALLGPDPRNTNRPNLLVSARVAAEDLPRTLAAMEAAWKAFAPSHPFAYRFLDDDLDRLYRAERTAGRLFSGFALVALAIACFGLFALATHAAERRTKEVGIRKVLGASAGSIVALLSKDFAALVLLACTIAVPVAWLVAERWLEGFAYRVTLGPVPFLLAGGTALGIALLTVSIHALRAATADPVQALRYE